MASSSYPRRSRARKRRAASRGWSGARSFQSIILAAIASLKRGQVGLRKDFIRHVRVDASLDQFLANDASAAIFSPRHVVFGKTSIVQKVLLKKLHRRTSCRRRSEFGFELFAKSRDRVVTAAQEFQRMGIDFIHGVSIIRPRDERIISRSALLWFRFFPSFSSGCGYRLAEKNSMAAGRP